jgi:hypothetical protein
MREKRPWIGELPRWRRRPGRDPGSDLPDAHGRRSAAGGIGGEVDLMTAAEGDLTQAAARSSTSAAGILRHPPMRTALIRPEASSASSVRPRQTPSSLATSRLERSAGGIPSRSRWERSSSAVCRRSPASNSAMSSSAIPVGALQEDRTLRHRLNAWAPLLVRPAQCRADEVGGARC